MAIILFMLTYLLPGPGIDQGSINTKSNLQDSSYLSTSLNSVGTRHMSYLSGFPNESASVIKKPKKKLKSPLEMARNRIKSHNESTGMGRIVKKTSKTKKSSTRNTKSIESLTNKPRHSISSPCFKNVTGSSTPVKCHEVSFDTSAQIEEIFDIQRDIESDEKEDGSQGPINNDLLELKDLENNYLKSNQPKTTEENIKTRNVDIVER